tara:strand:- start:247 stop:1119 length:873 start_codon:yes stop_codon:yes gene_type:complete
MNGSFDSFDKCFELNNRGGVQYLIDKMSERFANCMSKKQELVSEQFKNNRDKYDNWLRANTDSAGDEDLMNEARDFISALSVDKHAMSKLINEVTMSCPGYKVLKQCFNASTQLDEEVIGGGNMFPDAIDNFVDQWIDACKESDWSSRINTDKDIDFDAFFNKISKFWKDNVVNDLKSISNKFFEVQDSHVKSLQKYIYWSCSNSLMLLNSKKHKPIPTSAITTSGFNTLKYQQDILEVWKTMLPQVYVDQYIEPAHNPQNDKLLAERAIISNLNKIAFFEYVQEMMEGK